ncbi:MAG: alpha/beta hydrolase fold domain-containing protein, partial [Bacillota bacterium]|nr:alpha/beta hydrolase fold domain-containing protein [Bacillota bacterium]
EKAGLAAALSYVNPDTPPFYIIHGTADPVVLVEESRNLAKKLEENGCSVRLVEINDAVHADPRIYQKETRDEIEAFLKRVFAEPALPFQEHVRMDRAIQEPFLTMLENVVFAQTPYWFPYYNYKDLDLDLLLPVWGKEGEKHPLLVWICGGAFLTMEKAAYLPWLMYFARAGYVIASVQYRLSNVAKFPAPLEDVKKAIRFLHAHAEEFYIDKTKTVVGGESAGGYLASMTGLTNDRKEYEVGEYPEESSHVDAVIDFYGPADSAAYGNVTKDAPPFFMAHGTGDTLVDCKGSDAFYEELKKNGIPVEYFVVKDAPHMGMEFYQKEMADRILGFLDRNL